MKIFNTSRSSPDHGLNDNGQSLIRDDLIVTLGGRGNNTQSLHYKIGFMPIVS